MKKFLLPIFCIFTFTIANAQWQKTNGPLGGPVSVVTTSPGGQIFAGTGGGIYTSINNGDTWTFFSNGFSGKITAIAFYSNFIFAGTDNGVYRSSDNGANWVAINNGITILQVTSLAISPGGVIYAGTLDYTNYSGGIYRSVNNGDTWTSIKNGMPFPAVISLSILPNGSILAGQTIAHGIYLSTNNGDLWTRVVNEDRNVNTFAVNSAGVVFAGYIGGVMRSLDNGNTWTTINSGLTSPWIYALSINLSSGEIFAGGLATSGGTAAFHSTNNGDTWTPINGLPVSFVHSILITSGNIIIGSDAGTFRSTNNGGNWSEINNGIIASNVSCLAINSSGHIFASYSGTGISRSTDNGNTWVKVNNGLDLSVQRLVIKPNGDIYAGTYNAGLFRSTDNGASWTKIYDPFYHTISALAINSSGHIFIGTPTASGPLILRSTDNGVIFTPKTFGITSNYDVLDFAINANGDIFAGFVNDGLFRSIDNGEHWTEINNGFTAIDAGRIVIAPNGSIFVAPTYYVSGIYRSTNNGDTWNYESVVPNYLVQSLAVNINGDIYAGTDGAGIYKSTDNGNTWTEVNEGLTNKTVLALKTSSNGYTYAGTLGSGVFKRLFAAEAPLPVTLLNFTGHAEENKSILNWQTASEQNTSHFSIQRSADGVQFLSIGSMPAAGNSSSILNYSYTDVQPLKGSNYYRLQTIDIDGSTSYSRIIKINFDGKYNVSVFPNPAHDHIKISGAENFKQVQLINLNGSIVQQWYKPVVGEVFKLQNISKGLYYVKLIRDNEMRVIKLLIGE